MASAMAVSRVSTVSTRATGDFGTAVFDDLKKAAQKAGDRLQASCRGFDPLLLEYVRNASAECLDLLHRTKSRAIFLASYTKG
jgi:hypothetical protein